MISILFKHLFPTDIKNTVTNLTRQKSFLRKIDNSWEDRVFIDVKISYKDSGSLNKTVKNGYQGSLVDQ